MLRRLLITIVLVCGTLNFVAQGQVLNQGQEVQKIGIGVFREINTRGNVHLIIDQSDSSSSISVECINLEPKNFSHKVRKGILYIDIPSGLLDGNGFARVVVSSKLIEKIKCEGATVESRTPIKGDYFEFSTEGSKNLAKLNVQVNRLKVTTSGQSDVMVGGSATEVDLSARMGSRIDAFKLKVESAIAQSYDGSEIYVCPTQTLKAKATMAGTIYYMGTETVEPKVSMWGDVILIGRTKYKPLFFDVSQTTTTAPSSTAQKSELPVDQTVEEEKIEPTKESIVEKQDAKPAAKQAPKQDSRQVSKPSQQKAEKKQSAPKTKPTKQDKEQQNAPSSTSDGDFF